MKFSLPSWLRLSAAQSTLRSASTLAARYWKHACLLGAYTGAAMVGGYLLINTTLGRIETLERMGADGMAAFDHAFDWAERMVRGEAAVRAQAQRWVRFPTELQDLEMNIVALSPAPTRAGAMTQLDRGLLLTTTSDGEFVVFDTATAAHAPAKIASPINLATFKAHPQWNTPGLIKKHFRVNDILAIKEEGGSYTLFASHHWFTPECTGFRLSRTEIVLEGNQVRQKGAWKTIFIATPCFPLAQKMPTRLAVFAGNLSGGRMIDYDAKHLLMTIGDQMVFEVRGVNVAQDPSVTMGKIVLVDKETGETSIFASGERNGQGLLRDSRGRIWETEHGPRGGDELNLVREGSNLGWPHSTYGVDYDARPWPGATLEGRHDRDQAPVFAWVPSIGVSNLVEAPAAHFPNWRGDLLVGSLRGTSIFRVRLDGDHAVYAEQIGLAGRSVRDMEVLPDGRIAVLDNRFSMILLRNAEGPGEGLRYDPESGQIAPVAGTGLSSERLALARHGGEVFGAHCAECHSLFGASTSGPQLRDVAGRNVASQPGFAYSEVLARAPGAWNEAALARFIANPESLGEAIAMPNPGLSPQDAQAVAAYLVEVRRQDRRDRKHKPGDAAAATPEH